MDVGERITGGLPPSVEELDAGGLRETAELWLLARAYSRLRHRSRCREKRRDLERLKVHCIRAALAREPDLFIVALDPGYRSLRFVYHRTERSLLHLPASIELDGP